MAGMHSARQAAQHRAAPAETPRRPRVRAEGYHGAVSIWFRSGAPHCSARWEDMRTRQPDRQLEWDLIGAWDQHYAGHVIGEIELFLNRTYKERSYPASKLAATIYQEFGGQDCSGPWQAFTTDRHGVFRPLSPPAHA